MNPLARFTVPSDVMSRQVADEVVILDLASGNYYGLDPIGARIWQLLAQGNTPAEAERLLLSEYEVEAEQLRRDIDRLIGELLAKRLLVAE